MGIQFFVRTNFSEFVKGCTLSVNIVFATAVVLVPVPLFLRIKINRIPVLIYYHNFIGGQI
jgi:hypothetical protein